MTRSLILFLFFMSMTNSLMAKELPYDPKANAKQQLAQAQLAAKQQDKLLLIAFGANWCPDCIALDKAISRGQLAELIKTHFVTVKVDIGRWDNNMDIVKEYGNPVKKGIPSIVVTSADNKVLFATKGGQLATARRMGSENFYSFFTSLSKLKTQTTTGAEAQSKAVQEL
ncbi:thioredoxin family protein [Endozoicomonas sp. SM1973]|uniref:Thioredoxin family protein n=1 Tax=Spartinivicinus marinus TaxID=2994442 RepID=A0A853IBY0_9GAMM|nr:thioredoxin family protein [Spartinivicinus marinus]MCX4029737.1 thioredoxin family protein [Spartinivicinus marinus]NYZ68068.1 thioredoxin family protein [Spartinivicinus marinus]